jgi:multidrug efflux pump
VGSGVPRFYLPLDQMFPQTNVSQLIVLPKDLATREACASSCRLAGAGVPRGARPRQAAAQRAAGALPGAVPRGGHDPQCCASGPTRSRPSCAPSPNTRGVNDNWNESVKVLRLEVDQAKARALGVTSQSIAQASKTMLSGTTVGQYREGDKLIDIVLRQPLDERNAITDIANAYLPTASGKSIPLTQIAKPVFTWEPGVMWRENRDYAITVQGDIAEGLQGATVTNELLPQLKRALEAKWPQAKRGRATASRWPARWRRAARARRPSPRVCRSCCSSPSRC